MSLDIQTGPHWLEMAFWASQICLTLIAAVTARFAYRQLLALKQNSDQELRIAHSTLILSLDHRFDTDLFEARGAFKKAQDEIKAKILMLYPRAGPTEKHKKTHELWATKLAEMRETELQAYLKVMSLCGFFETVGTMVKLGYIDKSAILNIFEGAIMSVDNCFREHIDQRQKEDGMPEGYHENAIYLFGLCTRKST